MSGQGPQLIGVECVIDKDLASELLARELKADLFVMLTDADAVYVDWGKPTQKAIRRASPEPLANAVRRRVDGTEGRRRLPVRHGDRQEGRNRRLADLNKIIEAGGTTMVAEHGLDS